MNDQKEEFERGATIKGEKLKWDLQIKGMVLLAERKVNKTKLMNDIDRSLRNDFNLKIKKNQTKANEIWQKRR